MQDREAAILYICATPIGNLEDITLRALRILKEVDLIAAEDTRETKKLLDRYNITTPLTSYHKFNLRKKTDLLIRKLKKGASIALTSDAGMPGISDPGYELIKEAIVEGITVIPVPGPSAAITALAISGLPTDKFVFEGFLPRIKGKRRKILEDLKKESRTIIIYEAPHRTLDTLEDIMSVLGNRKVSVARELTKKFEEVLRGKVKDILVSFKTKKPKGELVIIIEGSKGILEKEIKGSPFDLLNDIIKAGVHKKDAAKIIARYSEVSKNELYKRAIKMK